MKKKLVLIVVAVMLVVTSVLTGCSKGKAPVAEDTTFTLEVRAYNGVENNVAKLDGKLLASKTITVKAGQVTVADALNEIAPAVDGVHKITFGSDYLTFTETTVGYSTSWYLNGGSFAAEPNYIPGDFEWSYMSYNDHYSNGVTMDFLDGLNVYVIVIDGYDGTTGSNPAWQ